MNSASVARYERIRLPKRLPPTGYDSGWIYEFADGYRNDNGKIDSPESAFIILANAELIGSNGVGAGGSLPAEVESFRLLFSQPDAREAFTVLYRRHTTPAAGLYALIGLHELDHPAYQKAAREFPWEKGTIEFLLGCMGSTYYPFDLRRPIEERRFVRHWIERDWYALDHIPDSTWYTDHPPHGGGLFGGTEGLFGGTSSPD
jgi:hypothetical protein